jgi:acylphosphatase
VTVRYWAGAQRAAGVEREQMQAASVADLRAELESRPALAKVATVASFLVDGQQAADTTVLHDGAEVDVLPPFAGGSDERVQLRAEVSGDVQGVGFRDWVRRRAQDLQLAGSATNRPDGRVEVVACGPRDACERLLAALRGGGTPGRVTDVHEEWERADDAASVGFSVR